MRRTLLGNSLSFGNGQKTVVNPTMQLNFAQRRNLLDVVTNTQRATFIRGSAGTFVDQSGVVQTAAVDVPRFQCNPVTGTSLGLLIEQLRTNFLLDSNVLTSVNWGVSGVTAAAVGTALNGTSAFELTEDATTAVHTISAQGAATPNGISVTSGQAYTASVFLKKSTVDWVQLTFGSAGFGSTVFANVNLATGAIGNTNGVTCQVIQYAGGWYQVAIIGTATATALTDGLVIAFTNNTNVTSRLSSYAGSTANKIHACMAQFEAGNCSTSYIDTTTAAVTRSPDRLSFTGTNFSSWYRPDEGTIGIDMYLLNPVAGVAQTLMQASDGTVNNAITLAINSAGLGALLTSAGGVQDGQVLSVGTATFNQRNIIAGSYSSNALGLALSFNGEPPLSDTQFTIPTVNIMRVGFDAASANRIQSGVIGSIAYFPASWGTYSLQQIIT